MRRLFTLAAVILAAGPATADYPPSPDKDGVVRIALEVSPAKPPVPASKYNLYPEYRDQQPGNRVQGLLRTFAEQDDFFANKVRFEQRDKWQRLPLAELPADVREQARVNSGMMYDKTTQFLGIADYAARFSRTEWNEYFDLRKDGINMLLPEVQKMRYLAAAIQLRLRGEIKAGEWPRAVESVKTIWGIAQALEQHPTFIGNLVGIAIYQIGLNGVEEMAGQPGCPSLFWALAAVPATPVDSRHGLEGTRVFPTATFQGLLDAKGPLPPAELKAFLDLAAETVKSAGDREEFQKYPRAAELMARPGAYFGRIREDAGRLAAMRKWLADRGAKAADIEVVPPAQLGLTASFLRFEELREELMKWYPLPYIQAKSGLQAADAAIQAAGKDDPLIPLLSVNALKVKTAETRLIQRTALLRAVEAVRLHAGATGQLPATLADTKLPLGDDPFTGKPFEYTLADGVATLRGANSTVEPAKFVVEYTIRLRK